VERKKATNNGAAAREKSEKEDKKPPRRRGKIGDLKKKLSRPAETIWEGMRTNA